MVRVAVIVAVVVLGFLPSRVWADSEIECRNGSRVVCSGETAEIKRILDRKNKIENRYQKLRKASEGKKCHSKRGFMSSPALGDEALYEIRVDCKVPRLDPQSLFKCGL
ncbi:hypothetical protein MK280_03525 [Myxococcota bacterium]|nr:hypothetical protein [Myxococcota bacterium]